MGTIRLQVADLERSIDWYREVLGLRVLVRSGSEAALGPAADGGAGEPLVELRERRGARPARPRGRLGLFHFAILLPDRPALGRLISHLSETGMPFGASDHLVSEAVYLQDPDGLGIEVYRDRPRSQWRREGGQLVMTTEPLDLRGVVDSGAGEPWAGMPADTVVGHVHLHVGDLDRAAAFYDHGLGFDRTVWSYPGALFLSAGGYHHHVGLNTWAGAAPPPDELDAQLLEWTLVVPSADALAAALERVEAVGGEVERGQGEGGARDPWGTAVRVRRS